MRGHSVEQKRPVKLDQNSSQLREEGLHRWCICWHAFAGVCVSPRQNMEAGAASAGEPAAYPRGFRPNIGSYLPNPIYSETGIKGSLAEKQ